MRKITMGNDEFILYIRKEQKRLQLPHNHTTADLGRKIWEFIIKKDPGAEQVAKDMRCLWETDSAKNIDLYMLPITATQFEFQRTLLPDLYDYLDTLVK